MQVGVISFFPANGSSGRGRLVYPPAKTIKGAKRKRVEEPATTKGDLPGSARSGGYLGYLSARVGVRQCADLRGHLACVPTGSRL